MLEQTLEMYGVPDNWEKVAVFYLEAVEDLPKDLLEQALKHIRMNLKWFPKPCEIRAPVMDQLAKRKGIISKIQTMKMGLEHYGVKS